MVVPSVFGENIPAVPEFIDPVFAKTSPKHSFLVIENELFGLVFAKTGSINSGTAEFGMVSAETACWDI